MKITRFTIIAASSLALATAAFAEEAKPKLASGDENFAKKAALGGMAEVKLGELAKDKGSTPEVKEFGSQMATDHGKANDELKGIASSKGIDLPADLDAKNKAVYEKLSKLSGAAFDKAYVHDMVRDHKEDAAEFEQASKSLSDPDLKGFAEKTLTVVKTHLEHAEKISEAVSHEKMTHEKK